VSNEHLTAVRPLQLTSGTKLVLFLLADHACPDCGLTWVGVRLLAAESCQSERRVQSALEELRAAGHLTVRAYATGGRCRSTQYIVLPDLVRLSTAPCAICQENLQRTARARRAMLRRGQTVQDVHPIGDTEWSKGAESVSKRVNNVHPKPQKKLKPQRARAREADPPASPSGAAAPPISDHPESPKDRRREVNDLLLDLVDHLGGKRPPPGKGGAQAPP
jgi:hypothetical protein